MAQWRICLVLFIAANADQGQPSQAPVKFGMGMPSNAIMVNGQSQGIAMATPQAHNTLQPNIGMPGYGSSPYVAPGVGIGTPMTGIGTPVRPFGPSAALVQRFTSKRNLQATEMKTAGTPEAPLKGMGRYPLPARAEDKKEYDGMIIEGEATESSDTDATGPGDESTDTDSGETGPTDSTGPDEDDGKGEANESPDTDATGPTGPGDESIDEDSAGPTDSTGPDEDVVSVQEVAVQTITHFRR
jgi:hypothetical protein